MRYTGPRNKVSRREGVDLGLKTPGTKGHATLLKKLTLKPGQHGAGTRKRKKQSERGKQLREKQKLRFMFGVTETQLKNYYNEAVNTKGNTGVILGQLLEQRLDNVIYRLGFAPTRASARQLVNHGHVVVNDKMVSVASYRVSVGDKVAFKVGKTAKIPYIETQMANETQIVPEWIERKAEKGKILKMPDSENIEKQVGMRLVIEFYSR